MQNERNSIRDPICLAAKKPMLALFARRLAPLQSSGPCFGAGQASDFKQVHLWGTASGKRC